MKRGTRDLKKAQKQYEKTDYGHFNLKRKEGETIEQLRERALQIAKDMIDKKLAKVNGQIN